MMSNYVIAVYVSSDPGTYMVRIRFTFQNRVWQIQAPARLFRCWLGLVEAGERTNWKDTSCSRRNYSQTGQHHRRSQLAVHRKLHAVPAGTTPFPCVTFCLASSRRVLIEFWDSENRILGMLRRCAATSVAGAVVGSPEVGEQARCRGSGHGRPRFNRAHPFAR
jgi:hypothetical protein